MYFCFETYPATPWMSYFIKFSFNVFLLIALAIYIMLFEFIDFTITLLQIDTWNYDMYGIVTTRVLLLEL